jgi:hypothetical protein
VKFPAGEGVPLLSLNASMAAHFGKNGSWGDTVRAPPGRARGLAVVVLCSWRSVVHGDLCSPRHIVANLFSNIAPPRNWFRKFGGFLGRAGRSLPLFGGFWLGQSRAETAANFPWATVPAGVRARAQRFGGYTD